ncbi:Catenin alpha-2 [Lonchura striata]|uniref:Catenin alpha-2 n=1 Tax=Lonchura striata TaxID=40157 RepID=A0A218UI01_9PASE|nr:Catenin alpha-2 [Lonchura striata domestica]
MIPRERKSRLQCPRNSRLSEDSSKEGRMEMCPMGESLLQAGRDMVLAAFQLQEHPDSPWHREHLAAATKRTLMETAKILQLEEAAGMRRITGAASWLLECLSLLRDAQDTPGLLAAFQAFSGAVLLLSRLTAKRLQELGDCPGGKSLAQTLQLLHKCVSLIHTAKQDTLTYSRDSQVDLSQDSVFHLTERTIRELLSLLMEPQDRSGIFSQQVSRLQALLSHPDPLRLSEGGFSSDLEAVILHGMLLAESSRLDLQLELVERCWVLLQLRRSICSHISQREGQEEHGLERECHLLREELENLDRAVLRATLCQILDGFFEEKEPLRQLVEGALSFARSGCCPAGPGGILRKLQPLIAAFFAQAQRILRAADLLLARATNSLLCCFEETIGMREFLELSILELAKQKEWSGLDGSNHPDILSPLREQVRSTKVKKGLEFSPSHTGTQTTNFHLDPWKGDTHPVITALLGASRAGDTDTVRAACSILLELSNGYVETAQEALPVAEAPQLQVLEQHWDIKALTPRIETQECLAAVAGDFPRGKQALDETLLGLARAVQVAGDIANTLNTKGFLEKAVSFRESCGMEKAILELHGVRWAIGMCVLLDTMDQFMGRDVLFLRELSRAVRNKEAARLSYLSCPGDHGAREILVLREEIQVLMEALLDVSNTLLLSPLPTASLVIRFELLHRDVALRAKVLLLHMERVNMEQLQLIQDVVGAALSNLTQEERERSKESFEKKANQLMADVQRPDLLSMADHLLLLTADVVGSAWRHFRSHQDTGDPHLDVMVWYWSAKAHYLATQLWVIHGIDRDILQCLTECLQRERFPGSPNSTAGPCPAPEPTEAAGIHPCRSRGHQDGPSNISPAKQERGNSDKWQGGSSSVSQVTQDMATRMFHMAQFLRRKGPIASKEQFVACARQMVADGQVVVKFGNILAKHCLDQRCSMELLHSTEHTQSISSQLSIVASHFYLVHSPLNFWIVEDLYLELDHAILFILKSQNSQVSHAVAINSHLI